MSIVPSCADSTLLICYTTFTEENFKRFFSERFTSEIYLDKTRIWTCESRACFKKQWDIQRSEAVDAYVTYVCGEKKFRVYCGFRVPFLSPDMAKSHEISLCILGSTRFVFGADLLLACYPHTAESLLPNSKKWGTVTCKNTVWVHRGNGLRSVYWFNNEELDVDLKWLLRKLCCCCRIKRTPEQEKESLLWEVQRNPVEIPRRKRGMKKKQLQGTTERAEYVD